MAGPSRYRSRPSSSTTATNNGRLPAPPTPTIKMELPQSTYGKTSPLVDRIPAEVRLAICRLVMQTPHGVATRPGSRNNNPSKDHLVNISLFLVNRLISQEAQDAFFEVNMIRVYDDMYRTFLITGLRHVQIAGPAAEVYCGHPESLRRAVDNLASLPKIRSIAVMCDGLNRKHSSIRKFIRDVVPGCELRCVGIGEYEVSCPTSTQLKLRFWDFKTTTLLTEAKELARLHTLLTLVMTGGPGRPNDVRLAACWLKCYEIMRLVRHHPAGSHVDPSDHVPFAMFARRSGLKARDIRFEVPYALEHVRLEELDVKDHGPEMVQWAGDMMAENFKKPFARAF